MIWIVLTGFMCTGIGYFLCALMAAGKRADKTMEHCNDAPWTLKELDDAKAKINYERRHRKWALEQCRTWQRYFCFYKSDAVRFHSDRADKAEAELAKIKKGAE